MVKTLKVKKAQGQQAINWLRKKGWLNTECRLGKTKLYLVLPLNKSAHVDAVLKALGGKIEEKNMRKIEKNAGGLKDKLEKVIPKKYLAKVNRSFDAVGTIAILDVPKGLEKLEKSIAWTLLRSTPGIKTVAKRASTTSGEYRIRKIKVLVGDKTTETVHVENGVQLKLDLNKVYFSPRWVTERRRIANLVKPREKVLVMFAGVGPFSLVINKVQPKVSKIVSVEINKDACKYLNENIRLNCGIYSGRKKPAMALMQEKHESVCADVTKVLPNLREKFDRIVMPLPQTAIKFLKLALSKAKKGAIVHLYTFAGEKELAKLKRELPKKYKIKILKVVTCGAYAPGVNRYCFDLRTL